MACRSTFFASLCSLALACTSQIGGGTAGGDDDDGVPGQPDAGTGVDDESCPNVAVRIEPVLPIVLLLIDQSGSMNESFGGPTRWQALKTALVDPTTGVVARLQDRVVFGATLYSSLGGNAGGTCPLLVPEAPALNNYTAIASLLNSNSPQADTPTAESVAAVYPTFPQVDPEEPQPRILVLATDGNPDNCVDPDAHDLGSQQMSELQVQNAYGAGIKTIVLSVGDDVAEPHLQRLANAGVGLPMNTGTAPYYVATSPAQLVDAFDEIIRGTRVCTFTLEGNVDLAKAPDADVELNGMPLEYGTDWRMVDENTLELLGAACEQFLETDEVVLTGEFPCGAVVL